jgi:hypothetical protein
MTSPDAHEASADRLQRLMTLAPDPDRAERVRARCRGQLGRSRRRGARTAVITRVTGRVIGPVIVGAICVLYAALLVATTLRLEGLLP